MGFWVGFTCVMALLALGSALIYLINERRGTYTSGYVFMVLITGGVGIMISIGMLLMYCLVLTVNNGWVI